MKSHQNFASQNFGGLQLSDFSYTLPQRLIAQKPATPRDSSRLLVVQKEKNAFQHLHFRDITRFLKKGDVLVMNNSRVIPARLFGVKNTGGKVEVLLVQKKEDSLWHALLKNFKHTDIGKRISIQTSGLLIEPLQKVDEQIWLIRLNKKGKTLQRILESHGSAPTPPYIKESSDLKKYQTVYAEHDGSVAAPTAGFHFTEKLLQKLEKQGVHIYTVTLHVGPGTFLPIRSNTVSGHKMHSEQAWVNAKTAACVNAAKKEGRRIIAVGTTSVRTLESFASSKGLIKAGKKDINLFLYPGYQFKIIDSLITNFHLPESTLLLLVCAFAEWKENSPSSAFAKASARQRRNLTTSRSGTKKILKAYHEAVRKKYRFYSFGDSMIIL